MNDTGIPNKEYLVIIEKPLQDKEGELTLCSPYSHKPLAEGDCFHFKDWYEFVTFVHKNIKNQEIKLSAFQIVDGVTSMKYLRLDPVYIANLFEHKYTPTEPQEPNYNVSENIVKFAKGVVAASTLAQEIDPTGDTAIEVNNTRWVWEGIINEIEEKNCKPAELLRKSYSTIDCLCRHLVEDQTRLKTDLGRLNAMATANEHLREFIHYGRLQNTLTTEGT